MADSARDFDAALAEVLAQFGRRVVDRPDQLRGALSDTLGATAGEHRSQVDAVVVASREGVAGEIRDSGRDVAASPEQIRAWFDQLVSAGVSLRDAALATRSWAEVFDATETARVTSELSEQLLGSDAGRPAGSTGSTSSVPVTPPAASLVRGGGLEEDATDLGDGSVLGGVDGDRTRMPGVTEVPPRPPLPAVAAAAAASASAAASPAIGEPHSPDLNETLELTGAIAPPAEPAGQQRETPLRRVLGWAPAMLAVAAVVIALVVAVPVIQDNNAETPYDPVTPAAFTGIGEPDTVDSVLLTKAEMTTMLLSKAELKNMIPASTYAYDPYAAAPHALLQSISNTVCKQTLKLATDGGVLYRSNAGVSGAAGAWADVYASGAWYATAAEAQKAFNALGFTANCSRATMVGPNNFSVPVRIAQSAGKAGAASVLRTVLTRDDGEAFRFQRDCYLRANVVTCYVSTGYEVGRVSDGWRGANRTKGLDKKANTTLLRSQIEVVP